MNITWISSPAAIVAVPIGCAAYLWSGHTEAGLTLVLSVAALTFSQLVLYSSRRFEASMAARIDELLSIFPEARDDLLHAEELTEREIKELRR